MKQQDKLRNTLREYYDNQQEPFNDEEWERASAYLNAERRKSRIRSSIFIFSSIITALFVVVFIALKPTGNEKRPVSLLPGEKAKPVSASRIHPTAVKRSTDATNTAILTPGSMHVNRFASAGLSSSDKTPQVVETIIPEPQPASAKQSPAVADAGDMVQTAPADHRRTEETMPAKPKDAKDATDPAPAKEMPQVPVDVLPQPAAVALTDPKKEIATDTVKLPAPKEAAASPAADNLLIAGTGATIGSSPEDTLSKHAPFYLLADEGIAYEAGAAWLYGWKGQASREARGFSPMAGISYMNRLSNRCALSFGVQYMLVPDLSNSSKTSRVSSYVYGEQNAVTVITPSTIHYLVAPLRFHYYASRHNSFGAGINLAYLLNVNATVTTYDESAGFKGNYKTIKQGGYTQGFSWFDAQLSLFYRRKISRSLALQAEVFLGLTDVKQDAFFGIHNKERNSGGKLSLIYYAFRKNGR